MPNPNGNPGNKGGGRKSAYEEKANAEFLAKMFFEEHDVDELRKIIEGKDGKKKYSVASALLAKALTGSERIMIEIFKKIYPDKTVQDITMNSKQELEEALNLLEKEVDNERTKTIQDRPPTSKSEPGAEGDISTDSGAEKS